MPEKNAERQESQESQHEGLSLHPLAQGPDAAPARQLKRPGEGPTPPDKGSRTMPPPAFQLAEKSPGGLPLPLKLAVEQRSGLSMDDVQVHYHSSEPAKLQAHAFAKGSDIFVGPGQEGHLPEEIWHVVQQKQGRVKATSEIDEEALSTDESLEKEARELGAEAARTAVDPAQADTPQAAAATTPVVQRAPADFAAHAVQDEPAVTGLFRTSYWGPLRTAVAAYALIDPADAAQRKNRLKLLREIGVFAQRWMTARGLPAKPRTELSAEELRKARALDSLELLLAAEYVELGSSDGNLGGASPGLAHVSPEPELTTGRSEGDGRKRGFFLANAEILNATGNRTHQPAAGVVCRVSPTETSPGGRPAQNYYAVRPAPGDDRGFGTVTNFAAGFILKTLVQTVSLDRAATRTLAYEDRIDPALHPLFPAPPTVGDVEQSGLGDCYLMAAILSIVRRNPTHFTDHMVDHGDGVVSVRLYEKVGAVFAPKIVHVRKSVVIRSAAQTTVEEGYNKGAIWVQLLEKAYIAAGFSGSNIETLPAGRTQWSQAASGVPEVALSHLTGLQANRIAINSVDPETHDEAHNWAGVRGNALHGEIWALDPATHARAHELTRLQPVLGKRIADLGKLHDEVRLDDVEPVITATPGMSAGLSQAIILWLRRENIYPAGKRGEALYSNSQKEAFRAVIAAVNAGQRIVASSKDHMKRGDNNRNGQSGGENVRNGLAGPHGYEVINFRAHGLTAHNPDTPTPATICWVQLRNPWGNTGRVYRNTATGADITQNDHAPVAAKMVDRATDNPEFWVPLEDFTKRFSAISVV